MKDRDTTLDGSHLSPSTPCDNSKTENLNIEGEGGVMDWIKRHGNLVLEKFRNPQIYLPPEKENELKAIRELLDYKTQLSHQTELLDTFKTALAGSGEREKKLLLLTEHQTALLRRAMEVVEESLNSFKVTQIISNYPQDHWSHRAQALLPDLGKALEEKP